MNTRFVEGGRSKLVDCCGYLMEGVGGGGMTHLPHSFDIFAQAQHYCN